VRRGSRARGAELRQHGSAREVCTSKQTYKKDRWTFSTYLSYLRYDGDQAGLSHRAFFKETVFFDALSHLSAASTCSAPGVELVPYFLFLSL